MFDCHTHTYSGVTDVSVVLLHTWQRRGQTAVTLQTEPCGEKCEERKPPFVIYQRTTDVNELLANAAATMKLCNCPVK